MGIRGIRVWMAALAGVVGLVPASGPAETGPHVGAAAPAFVATDSNGHMQALQARATEGGAVWLTVISSAPST